MHAPDHWIWRTCRHRRWNGALPDFQQRCSRPRLNAKYLSTNNDPLFRFHQWQANLRALEVTEIKTVLYLPLPHSFEERLIGTLRRECLDGTLFWTTADLENKLLDFKTCLNQHHTHAAREEQTPDIAPQPVANFQSYRWQFHCTGFVLDTDGSGSISYAREFWAGGYSTRTDSAAISC